MAETIKITELFGTNLAKLLADKITQIYPSFDDRTFIKVVAARVQDMNYTRRTEIIAEELRNFLPADYLDALGILMRILGPENPHETGMFTNYYWLMPVGKFVQLYGLDYFDESMDAIVEITKRNTGEYAVRPYIRQYPDRALRRMKEWARSDSFHLRRLASEGLRPKLPWAPKLDTFIADPQPVFAVLELLKEDPSKFVQKSVANHLTDYLKVNPESTRQLIGQWQQSDSAITQWIVRHATRKMQQ